METSWIDVVKVFVSNNTNIWLITTLLLIAYIGISRANDVFCNSKAKESCKNKSDEGRCLKLAQKDYRYLIVIILIVATFLVSLSLYANENAMSLFSFASTIASIILSVIAIILTISSETKNASTKEKLEKSAEQIETSTNLLEDASKRIDPNLLKDIGEKINKLDDVMKEAIAKIESALENTEATRKAFERKFFEGDPEEIKMIIPEELEGRAIPSNKYGPKEENKDA